MGALPWHDLFDFLTEQEMNAGLQLIWPFSWAIKIGSQISSCVSTTADFAAVGLLIEFGIGCLANARDGAETGLSRSRIAVTPYGPQSNIGSSCPYKIEYHQTIYSIFWSLERQRALPRYCMTGSDTHLACVTVSNP